MKTITIIYSKGLGITEIRSSENTLETLGLFQMATDHLLRSELVRSGVNAVLTEDDTEAFKQTLIHQVFDQAVQVKINRHPKRPKTIADLLQIESIDLLRIPGVGNNTVTAIRNYFHNKGIIWK